jgi:hypothetical protein
MSRRAHALRAVGLAMIAVRVDAASAMVAALLETTITTPTIATAARRWTGPSMC